MTFQVEFDFVLPRGYIDENGVIHKQGVMRLATAQDEITSLHDPHVRVNEAYIVIVLLTKVIVRLGTLPQMTPTMIERMFAVDLAYLQDFYRKINDVDVQLVTVTCPHCGQVFEEAFPLLGVP